VANGSSESYGVSVESRQWRNGIMAYRRRKYGEMAWRENNILANAKYHESEMAKALISINGWRESKSWHGLSVAAASAIGGVAASA
jgi:hypothetical protein